MKLNRIIVLSVFCSQLNNTKLYSQDSLTKRELINHWVLYSENPNYNSANHDTLEYIPYSLNIVKDLPLHLRYSGTIFEENHVVTHQYWTKCGNETRPAPEKERWEIIKEDEKSILSLTTNSEVKIYYIYFLSKNKLILIAKK